MLEKQEDQDFLHGFCEGRRVCRLGQGGTGEVMLKLTLVHSCSERDIRERDMGRGSNGHGNACHLAPAHFSDAFTWDLGLQWIFALTQSFWFRSASACRNSMMGPLLSLLYVVLGLLPSGGVVCSGRFFTRNGPVDATSDQRDRSPLRLLTRQRSRSAIPHGTIREASMASTW